MDTQIKVGAIIEDNDKILLIKEWSNSKNGYFWNIIKGTFDGLIDDTFEECVIREAMEEIGVSIQLSKFIKLSIKHGFSTRIYVNFVASIVHGKPKIESKKDQATRNEDIIEAKWFTKHELNKMDEDKYINDVAYETVTSWLNNKTYSLDLLVEKKIKG